MNTLTTINWKRTRNSDGSQVHSGSRARWTFVIHTPKSGPVKLRSTGDQGQSFDSVHPTTALAKAAAFDVLHPAEAMAWNRDRRTGDYVARWEDHAFRAYRHHGILYFESSNADQDVRIESLPDARRLAVLELEAAYGPVVSCGSSSQVESQVSALESALRAAGIRFTAKQLAVAAIALSSAS